MLRNSIHFGSQYLWATSLLLLPLATVFALEFTMPAWTMLLASLFLGERMTTSRIGAVVLGLVGVLVILRPGHRDLPAGRADRAGGGARLRGAEHRHQEADRRRESTFAIVFWMNVIQLPLGLLGADPLVRRPSSALHQLPALAGLGIAGLSAHYCLTNAFRAGDASLVVPLDFLRIPLIAVVGWWLYGEPLDVFVFAGAGIIIAGICCGTCAAKPGPRLPSRRRRLRCGEAGSVLQVSGYVRRRCCAARSHFGHHSGASSRSTCARSASTSMIGSDDLETAAQTGGSPTLAAAAAWRRR